MLAVSWMILGWLALKESPLVAHFSSPQRQAAMISLGDTPVYDYGRMGFTRGLVRASPVNDGWMVGTDNGEVIGFDRQGRQLWRKSIGIGKITAMTYSNDGRVVAIGEQSPSGNIYAINASTGEVEWTYATANVVGADLKRRSYPSVMRIQMDETGNYYAATFRYARINGELSEYAGRICSLTSEGKERWLFPQTEPMDAWVSWFAVDKTGENLVFATANFESTATIRYQANLYWLKNSVLAKEINIPPVAYYARTVMRGSPYFNRDGTLLTAMASDGRGFAYNQDGELLWQNVISKPQRVADSWINAVGRDALPTREGVLFTTVNTYNRDNWQLATPVEHPSSNSLFMFDNNGAFRYQWCAGGGVEEVDYGEHLAVVGVGRNLRTKDISVHGAAIISLSDGALKDKLQTEGPCQAVALSADEKTIAAIEAPALMADGRIIGAYRLHFYNIKQ